MKKTNLKTIAYPASIDLQSLFPSFSNLKLEKVAFLINQINYYSGITIKKHCTISSNRFKECLGLSTKAFQEIINTLIENNIIVVSEYDGKNNVRGYGMVNLYDLKDDKNKRIVYNTDSTVPTFIQRWVSDGHLVKTRENSNFNNMENSILEENITLQEQVCDLRVRVEQLELLVSKLSGEGLPELKHAGHVNTATIVSAPEQPETPVMKLVQPAPVKEVKEKLMNNMVENKQLNNLKFENSNGEPFVISKYAEFKQDVAALSANDKSIMIKYLLESETGSIQFENGNVLFEFVKANPTIVTKHCTIIYLRKRIKDVA
jgi:hypothetical protein